MGFVLGTTLTNSPATGPTNAETSLANADEASCSAHPSCAALGLEGVCCPTTESVYLICCEQTVSQQPADEEQASASSPGAAPSSLSKPYQVLGGGGGVKDLPTLQPSASLQLTDAIPYEANAAILSGNFTVGACTYTTAIYADVVDYGGVSLKDDVDMFYVIRKWLNSRCKFDCRTHPDHSNVFFVCLASNVN
jgi:hypothetical protein